MIRLGLLRHGHTAWNREGRIQGRTDIPLDAEARAQLGGFCLPDGWRTAHLVSSPLLRAVDTATLISDQQPETIPALMEMDWGAWEGAFGKALRADPSSGFRDIDAWGWDYRPPHGESPADLRQRLHPWASGLERDTLAICHIGVMRVLMALATDWNFDGPAPFQIKRNRIFVIEIKGENWTEGPVERLVERSTCGC